MNDPQKQIQPTLWLAVTLALAVAVLLGTLVIETLL